MHVALPLPAQALQSGCDPALFATATTTAHWLDDDDAQHLPYAGLSRSVAVTVA